MLLVVAGLCGRAATPEQVLTALKGRIAPDRRTAVWNVNATTQNGQTVIYGTVGTQEQKDSIDQALAEAGINASNTVIVLQNELNPNQRWGLVKLSIATLRTQGKHAAEAATQAIMGTPVRVLQIDDDWLRVQTPDQYIAWVPASSVALKTSEEMQAWRAARRYVVTVYGTRLVTEPKGDETVTDLVLSNMLEYRDSRGGWLQLATPDGRTGWVKKDEVQELGQWAAQDFNAALIEKTARRMMGSGYLWGGTSTKVTDCSGLVKVSYLNNGIILARDASQQALYGLKIKGEDWRQCQTGDLLFFGNASTGRVTHVGIYLRDGLFIHCSGQVKINSLDPGNPLYLYSPLSCSRIQGQLGTPFITQVRNHPWYF